MIKKIRNTLYFIPSKLNNKKFIAEFSKYYDYSQFIKKYNRESLKSGFKTDIVKFDMKKKSISFMNVDSMNVSHPKLLKSLTISNTGKKTIRNYRNNNPIYHRNHLYYDEKEKLYNFHKKISDIELKKGILNVKGIGRLNKMNTELAKHDLTLNKLNKLKKK